MAENLPNKPTYWAITNQIIRSATSVAANYRAVCRAKSDKDFVSKIGTVIEEADESLFWIELLDDLVAESMDVKNFIEMTDLLKLKIENRSQRTSLYFCSFEHYCKKEIRPTKQQNLI
jgi:four helix bundle protein